MIKYVFWLGSNATLSQLELSNALSRQSLPYRVMTSNERYIIIASKFKLAERLIDQLGGVDRIGMIIGEQETIWTPADVSQALSPSDKKMMVGLSKFDLPKTDLSKMAKEIKKQSRRQGMKLNYLLPRGKSERLNAAQVIFNNLCREPNAELTIWRDNSIFYLARTEQVQDIQAYELRDTQRPARDAKVGLLPPKLAQILLNLIPDSKKPMKIYDPFCGMGTVLQEGWLMGQAMIGSDISERMVQASDMNIKQLAEHWPVRAELWPKIFVHDINQPVPAEFIQSCDAIVTEPYLGPPLLTPLSTEEALTHHRLLMGLYKAMFNNIWPVLKDRGWVVMVWPAIVNQAGVNSSPTLFPRQFIDEVESIGYSFKQLGTSNKEVIYARPDALIAREITLWQKN